MSDLFEKIKLIYFDVEPTTVLENVIKESSITLVVNGQTEEQLSGLLGKQQKELVIGHLFARGIINHISDIASLKTEGYTAEVTLKNKISLPSVKKPIESSLKITADDVFNCVRAVLKSPVFAETEGVHSAGLFLHGKEPVFITEDIGRHHAIDKVIGAALLQGVSLNETLLASTGRMASEMVSKICRAGIPIIATKAAVTDRGIALAQEYGVTLIGFVRETGSKMNTDMSIRTFNRSVMKIYSGGDRIRCN